MVNNSCPSVYSLHAFLVSAGSRLNPLAEAKQSGLDITVKRCPHYLRFTESEMAKQESAAVASPPLRREYSDPVRRRAVPRHRHDDHRPWMAIYQDGEAWVPLADVPASNG